MRAVIFILCLMAGAAYAAPERYNLDAAKTDVGFSYVFDGQTNQGTMSIVSSDMVLDLDDIKRSNVSVTLNASKAKAGFVFATQALKSPEVLNTAAFPTIKFRSISVTGTLKNARIKGQLTVRGVTRPVTLNAKLYRQSGTDLGDRSKLSVLLTGQIDRREFGAVGYPNLVGPMIGLRILARITR